MRTYFIVALVFVVLVSFVVAQQPTEIQAPNTAPPVAPGGNVGPGSADKGPSSSPSPTYPKSATLVSKNSGSAKSFVKATIVFSALAILFV
jgi:hypothetical protein